MFYQLITQELYHNDQNTTSLASSFLFLTPLLVLFALAGMAFGQGSTYLPNPGRYGLSAWPINNQRVASQYNYYIDSLSTSGLGACTFPPQVIYQGLPLGGGKYLNPFNTNATVKIVDINSTLTETVAFNSNSCTSAGGVASVCTLSLPELEYPLFLHSAFRHLRTPGSLERPRIKRWG